ncbi:hypothetical protein V6N13_030619 [Hibiscus sabdariffa]
MFLSCRTVLWIAGGENYYKFKPEISNMPSNEDQKLTGVSKAKDESCLLDPSASLERGFQ